MTEGVRVEYPVEVVWEGGMVFRGGRPGGPELRMDGNGRDAPSPVDALVVAIGSCAAIDVVEYLEKRRTPATSLSVRVRFSRAPTPPRRLTEARLEFTVATDSAREHVERAIQLSFDKYCSVANSLDPDLPLGWEVTLMPAAKDVAAEGRANGPATNPGA